MEDEALWMTGAAGGTGIYGRVSHGTEEASVVHIDDPRDTAWLDQHAQLVAEQIRVYGVHISYVIGDPRARRTSIAYTVGLFGIGHPEVLAVGLDPDTAMSLLNEVAARVRRGGQLVVGELLAFDRWPHRVVVEPSPNPGQIVFTANRHYQRPDEASVPVLQLTYDDTAGRFPWDDGYAVPPWVQPRPGRFTA
ncbi:DUF4262 domain-containing protein [Pengzhenrongella frigida]|uniref:DUF4262 domain-containing protein n=1 Tax=Pengzhenrongella frigida TaxID=1259133 RepID=A0A4Q5N266_9MICO|nr:DUF4262 domain-containing protein [Cellulomonas sp. HLT2-17]RYV52282.1 DUF4262 domain-containing protein [Cellulomonas sp. HLT2-17]